MLLIEKVYPNKAKAAHAYRWYQLISKHVPNIIAHEGSILKYEYIKGWQCRDPEKIHVAAKRYIWIHPRKEKLELKKYRSHVLSCCMDFNISRSLLELNKADLTTCDNVHGHLTSDHVIENSQGLFFINPDYSYGLGCQELDEAWLIYSFHGDVPFPIKEYHIILLNSLLVSQEFLTHRFQMAHHKSSFFLSHMAMPTISI